MTGFVEIFSFEIHHYYLKKMIQNIMAFIYSILSIYIVEIHFI